jgi:hypothetical protein
VRFPDVSQQVLFAQHAGLQAFSLAAFERMHGPAESGIAATSSDIASQTEIAILFSTALTSIAQGAADV